MAGMTKELVMEDEQLSEDSEPDTDWLGAQPSDIEN